MRERKNPPLLMQRGLFLLIGEKLDAARDRQELGQDEVRDGETGDDHDETNNGIANHVFGGRDLLFVTTSGHPEKTGAQDVEEQDDAQEAEHNIDKGTNDRWQVVGRTTQTGAVAGFIKQAVAV